jgi:glycerol kinase
VDKKKLDEILDELTVNDVLLMIEIAVEWLERTRRIQQRLRRATSLLGVSGYASREEMIYQMVAPMLQEELRRRMGYTATAEAVEEREVDAESYSKLKSMLEKIKREISGEEKKEPSQVNSKQS